MYPETQKDMASSLLEGERLGERTYFRCVIPDASTRISQGRQISISLWQELAVVLLFLTGCVLHFPAHCSLRKK